MSNAFDGIIFQAAQSYAVEPELVKAVVAAESNFDPRAYRYESNINDASRGLMQILGGTARWMGYSGELGDDQARAGGLYDPATNINLGTKFLRYLLNTFNQDFELAVSAYNAGPGNARRPFVNPGYVSRVMGLYRGYKAWREQEKKSVMMLQPSIPSIGPIPSSPTQLDVFGDAGLPEALSQYMTPENMPYIFAGVAVLAVVLLARPRR